VSTNAISDGLTWATAWSTIQAGLDAAAAGDEVWVASGAYTETVHFNDTASLFGGFSGAETNLAARNWERNVTALNGGQITVPAGLTNTTRIDGLTIRSAQYGETAISCVYSSPIIANNTITQIHPALTGARGVSCLRSFATITNNLILGNVDGSGGSPGGGIVCDSSSLVIVNNRFVNNSGAGAISCSRSSVVIAGNLFIGNKTRYSGGAINSYASTVVIANNRFIKNSVVGSDSRGGGAIACDGPGQSVRIISNTFIENTANEPLARSLIGGGAVFCSSGSLTIMNNTFVRNSSPQGGAIYIQSGATVPVANNIIAFGSSGLFSVGALDLRNNCIFANGTNNFGNLSDPTGTNGNLSVDPRLLENPGFADVRLQADSPCRDAGDSSVVEADWVDIDRQPRIFGANVDLGADEFDGVITAFIPQVVRVSTDGDDQNDGSAWTLSKRTIQAALDEATVRGGEVWVKAGTYPEQISLRLFSYLYGGFNGTETHRAQRDWKANVTVLDGQQTTNVVTASLVDKFSSIDGFTIQNGKAWIGGGIFCQAASPTITHNVIIGNTASYGGGLGCRDLIFDFPANPVVIGNSFVANTAIASVPRTGFGGGLYMASSRGIFASNLIVSNITTGLTATGPGGAGGGIFCASSTPSIINNTIVDNISGVQGTNGLGGGIYGEAGSGVIANNIVAFGSSGIYLHGTLRPSYRLQLLNNCVFGNSTNNYAAEQADVTFDPTGTNGNISVDPLFLNPTKDFHLRGDSPCLDTGDDTLIQADWLDLDGQPRILGAPVDMGAYETLILDVFERVIPSSSMVRVAITPVGGITYAQYTVTLPDSCHRLAGIDPLVRVGRDFSRDFKIERQTGIGVACLAVIKTEIGVFVLGKLEPDSYAFTVNSRGNAIVSVPFTVPANADPTLTPFGLSENGQFQFRFAGVFGVKYVLEATTNLFDWRAIATNSAPDIFVDEQSTNYSSRFYRLLID
jgi:hypothetical protein